MATQQVTLGYWNIRGYAERQRLLLQYLKIPYNQVIFTPETGDEWFGKLKLQHLKKNPAANLPFLVDGDKLICENWAILIYLMHKANRADLMGQNIDDQTQVMTVLGVQKDLNNNYVSFIYGKKEVQEFKNEAIQSFSGALAKLNGLLGDKQWFASKITYADFIVAEFLQHYGLFDENFATNYPKLKAHQERIWALDGVKQYVTSERFKERPVNFKPYAKWA